jgi:hypothetical protein
LCNRYHALLMNDTDVAAWLDAKGDLQHMLAQSHTPHVR